MTTAATTFLQQLRKTEATQRIVPVFGYVRQFRYTVESSDWDKKILEYEEWANRICVRLIAASLLYFLILVVSIS